jgi:hypothetical protein
MFKKQAFLVLLTLLALVAVPATVAQDDATRPVITAENAPQVQVLARAQLGNGQKLAFSPDGTLLALTGWSDVWLVELANVDSEPRSLVGMMA